MMRIDDVIAELELDELDLAGRLELLYQRCLLNPLWRNDVLLCRGQPMGGPYSSLQVAVHEVDLLQPAQALADVLRPDLSNSLNRLQLCVAGGQQLVQAAKLVHDLADRQLRQPRNPSQHAVAARRDGIVERIQLAVVTEQLGQPPEVQEVLMR